MIRISWYTVTTDLGSGKRFALWVQGCEKRCKGCIAPSLRDMEGGEVMDEEELIQAIVSSDAEGITISGGEPFLQSAALVHILDGVRRRRDMGVICYTGMRYEDIADDPLIGHIDLLIDGEYIEELDDGLPMRGSSNQRLIFLTDRYSHEDLPSHRTSTAVLGDGGMRLIGIPSKGAKTFLDIVRSDDDG